MVLVTAFILSELTARLLCLTGRGQRLKVENLFVANELMPVLGELDRALILKGQIGGN